MFFAYYVHHLSPFLVQFGPGWGIRWYGLAYVAAFLTGIGLYQRLARRGYSDLEPEAVTDVAGVRAARRAGAGLALSIGEPHVALPALFARLGQRGARPTRLVSRVATLDDVFLSLTGRTLRED